METCTSFSPHRAVANPYRKPTEGRREKPRRDWDCACCGFGESRCRVVATILRTGREPGSVHAQLHFPLVMHNPSIFSFTL